MIVKTHCETNGSSAALTFSSSLCGAGCSVLLQCCSAAVDISGDLWSRCRMRPSILATLQHSAALQTPTLHPDTASTAAGEMYYLLIRPATIHIFFQLLWIKYIYLGFDPSVKSVSPLSSFSSTWHFSQAPGCRCLHIRLRFTKLTGGAKKWPKKA